jgi:NADPH:quinone reductase-like Zn-dependent oxidoreductase
MKVVGVIEPGGPESLQVVEVPEPKPGPGEVRLRVFAATVNPTDTYLRNGAYGRMFKDRPKPWVPGMDAAGEVDQLGEGVDPAEVGYDVGDRVMAIVVPTGPRGGAYQQLLVVPARSVAKAPAGTTHVEASTIPMNGLTAPLSLDQLGLQPGQTLAVTGAAGAYGGYVVQLAKADGLRVLADASEADEELVRSLGADVVVRRGDDVAERFREHAPDGVDGLCDGSVQNTLVLPAIKDGGGLAAIRPFVGETERGIAIHQTWVHTYAERQDALDELRRLVEDGRLTVRVAQAFPKERAGEAHARLEAGGVRGRLVIEL